MDSLTLLREARRVGLEVDEAAGRLVIRGPRRLEPLARALLVHKVGVLAALTAERTAVEWRVSKMRKMATDRGALPLLLARLDWVRGPGRCCSCGDPLGPDDRYRCRPCVEAVIRVLESIP